MGLLRCSRGASRLNKEASVGGRAARWAGRGVEKGLGGIGGFAMRHPVGTLATVGGLSAGVAFSSEDVRRGLRGMSPQYLAARRAARLQGRSMPAAPGQFRGRLAVARELAGHGRHLGTIGSNW